MTTYRSKTDGSTVEAEQFTEGHAQAMFRAAEANTPSPVTIDGLKCSDQGGFVLDTGSEPVRVALGDFIVQHGEGFRSAVPGADFAAAYQRLDDGTDERAKRLEASLAAAEKAKPKTPKPATAAEAQK